MNHTDNFEMSNYGKESTFASFLQVSPVFGEFRSGATMSIADSALSVLA